MKHYLALVEKPSACREFQKVYNSHRSQIESKIGGDIEFFALAGHLVRNAEPKELQWDKKWQVLYEEDLPMIPSEWVLKPIDRNKNILNELKKKIKDNQYDGYIAMTDSDQEGNLIYHLVATYLEINKCETLRFFETSLTEKDILASFMSMEDFYKTPRHANTTKSGVFRSRWDWLIGMNLTTAYTVRFGELTKFGSVKAPTLRLIYKNCMDIDSFVPHTTYGVKSQHTDGFESTLLNDDDNKDRSFETKAEAEQFIASLAMQATVKSFKKETKIHKAPKLYSLSDLQVDAAKQGYSPDKTLEIAQKLYEERKILSYPRTSGTHLASGKVADLPDLLASIKDIPDIKSFVLKVTAADIARVSTDTNIINDKEVAKASHDALIPTGHKVDWAALTKPEQDIFLLVAKRFLAHFMPLFSEEKYVLTLDNNGNPFKSNGRKTIENGFNDLYGKVSKDVVIPEYKTGDIVKIDANVTYEKTSTPPARYTMGTIINAMKNIASQVTDPEAKKRLKESEGIGTEATRANILKELVDTGYISVSNNAIYITDAGKRYIENIRQPKEDGSFDYGIADPLQVAYWSGQNKLIQLGEKTIDEVMANFEKYLAKKITDLKTSGDPIKRSRAEQAALGLPTCPLCGGKVASGKFGYYCSTYKESGCKLSIPNEMAGKKLTDNQKKGLLEGKKIHAKGFKSKAGKEFEADVVLNKETGKVEFDFSSSQKNFPKKK
jgi:DNA topoisomerase-3